MSATESTSRAPLRAFVRSAWIVLTFQLIAAAVAVGVTGWAAFQVRPLLVERDRLALVIVQAQERVAELAKAENVAHKAVVTLDKRAVALRDELQGAREATPILTEAIKAFHANDYERAVVQYEEVLTLNSRRSVDLH